MPDSRFPVRVRAGLVGIAVYGAVLAVVGFWPVYVDTGATGLVDVLESALPFLGYSGLERLANVLLFLPLGAFLSLLPRRPAAGAVAGALAGLGLSALIETVQTDFLAGRMGSVADVILNTIGAALGGLVVAAARARADRRRRRAGAL